MKNFIKAVVPFLLLIFTAAFTLCFSFLDVCARSSGQKGVITVYIPVCAEPGEDPHLRVEPQMLNEFTWSLKSSGEATDAQEGFFSPQGENKSIRGGTEFKNARAYTRWRMLLKVFLGTLMR